MRRFLWLLPLAFCPSVRAEEPVQEAIGALLKLGWKDGKLSLDRKHWEKASDPDFRRGKIAGLVGQGLTPEQADEMAGGPLELLFDSLQEAAGGGSSSRCSTNGALSWSFDGDGATGRLRHSGDAFQLEVGLATGLSLDLQDDPKRGLRISLLSDEEALFIQRTAEGRFRVARLGGPGDFVGSADSFRDFYRKHRKLVDDELFPRLREAGILPPFTPEHPAVVAAALARLRPPEEDRARALILQLDADAFDLREAATKTLSEGYLRWKGLISAAAVDPKASEESRTRLRRIQDEHGGDDEAQAFLGEMRLLEDPEFRATALKAVSEEERGAVDQAWEGWLAKRQSGKVLGP